MDETKANGEQAEKTESRDMDSHTMQQQLFELQKLMQMQMQVMDLHTRAIAQPPLQAPTPTINSHVKHVKAPEGRYDMNAAEYRMYSKDCRDFKTLTHFTDEQIVIQMRLNMDAQLKRAVDTNFGARWNTLTVEDALTSIKDLIRCTSNIAIFRKEFDSMIQKNGESIREYVTRLKGCALDCEYICPFDDNHDLTEYHIINRIRGGIEDKQLQQELLQKSGDMKTLTNIVMYCEMFESAKSDRDQLRNEASSGINAVDAGSLSQEEIVAALSTYKKSKQKDTTQCHYCGHEQHEKLKCPAFGKKCTKCNRMNHFASVCNSNKKGNTNRRPATGSAAVIISTIEEVGEYTNASVSQLPYLDMVFSKDGCGRKVKMKVVADTGAQACVAGTDHMKLLNLSIKDLKKPSHELKHVGGNKLSVVGSHILQMEHNQEKIKTEVYFVKGIVNVYLSIDVCKLLHIIPETFPFTNTKSAQPLEVAAASNSERKMATGSAQPTLPPRPKKNPFLPMEDNVPLLEKWLLDKFSDTTFNVNADQLPTMKGKPHKIHLKEDAVPVAAHTPIPIPYHWKKEVKAQLDRDEKLEIIQKAPVGEASEWCMRMVVVTKADGSPRRTIDFQPINKDCIREAHFTPTPFQAVSSIPKEVYKTVLDAFSGYHQVALDSESVKLTTFITEFGRYQYLRAPQGHMASGDGYVRRFDDIISDVDRKQKVVDDVLLHDDAIEGAFYHTFDFLKLCAENGVTINPEKFKFARREVDFVGYHVGWNSFKPSENTMTAIKNFPMPEEPSLSDIRSWYGLVNQLAPFIATSALMTPFRELLKSTHAFGNKVYWDQELQKIFNETKSELCKLVEDGLSFYDVKRKTSVVTDWSKTGIGFVILQKHCKCPDDAEARMCCTKGWKPVYCSSRHLDAKERNFRPIEGEALAVDWALKKGRLFLLGNENFDIIVDHKPLVKIFGDKPLHEIENPILQNFKERALPFSFRMRYIKGASNHADTLSRYPVEVPDTNDLAKSDEVTAITIASIYKTAESISITMDIIKEEAKKDDQYMKLCKAIGNSSFAENRTDETPLLKEFHSVKDRLTVADGVVMYAFEENCPRILIPKSLRQRIVDNLHSANQGSTSMLARARQMVYWPGMDRDITGHCERCLQCRTNAPSKQKEPLMTTDAPDYPFQKVVSDMFELDGYLYLVYVDRLTAFPELAFFPNNSSSASIMNVLREFFTRWGVPEEISLDGAPNYTSKEITDWLKSWGVTCRISSAYYPQSNGRAEVAVKCLKRLLRGNTGPRGAINNDKTAKALMQFRNTPLRDINKSPAELALGRPIRDVLPLPLHRYRINPCWARHLNERELSMTARNQSAKDKYDQSAKSLKDLAVGDEVICQDVRRKKWDKSGTIVALKGNRQYSIKMEGSGRLSIRNRRHVQKVVQKTAQIDFQKLDHSAKDSNNDCRIEEPESCSETMSMIDDPEKEMTTDSHQEGKPGNPEGTSPEVEERQSEEEKIQLRRSTRYRRPPKRYPDEA